MEYTKGEWRIKEYPGHGIEIYAEVNIGKDENGKIFQPIYHVDVNPSLHIDPETGKVYAMITYESYRQFPSIPFQNMQKANAYLISAAPDMYEALCEALDWFEDHPTASLLIPDNIRRALSKAEGKINV